jgi:hypothetical protein
MPFITSVNPVMGVGLAEALLSTLSARPAAALLATPTLHLYTSGPTPITPQSVPGDFTEATFTGYAAVTLGTFLGPIILPGTEGYGLHVEGDYLAGAVTPPGQNIAGYWVDNGAGTFYYGETFAVPIPLAHAGDFISLDVIWGQPVYLQVA